MLLLGWIYKFENFSDCQIKNDTKEELNREENTSRHKGIDEKLDFSPINKFCSARCFMSESVKRFHGFGCPRTHHEYITTVSTPSSPRYSTRSDAFKLINYFRLHLMYHLVDYLAFYLEFTKLAKLRSLGNANFICVHFFVSTTWETITPKLFPRILLRHFSSTQSVPPN